MQLQFFQLSLHRPPQRRRPKARVLLSPTRRCGGHACSRCLRYRLVGEGEKSRTPALKEWGAEGVAEDSLGCNALFVQLIFGTWTMMMLHSPAGCWRFQCVVLWTNLLECEQAPITIESLTTAVCLALMTAMRISSGGDVTPPSAVKPPSGINLSHSADECLRSARGADHNEIQKR